MMKIEVDAVYRVSNRNQVDAVVVGVWNKDGLGVDVRSKLKHLDGSVCPQTQEEVDLLQSLLQTKGEFRMSDIELHSIDDQSHDDDCFVFHEGWTEEQKAALEGELYDPSPTWGRQDLLEAMEYDNDYYEYYITDIVLEKVENFTVEDWGVDVMDADFFPDDFDVGEEWNRWVGESRQ